MSGVAVDAQAFVAEFAGRLRDEAERLRSWGAAEAAGACARAADELESKFRGWWLGTLSVADAAAASGYSEERLRELARDGKLPASRAAEGGPMLLRRCDLPRRPTAPPGRSGIVDLETRLLGVGGRAESHRGGAR